MKQPKGRWTALLAAVTAVSLLLSACVSPTIEARFRTVKLPVNISVSSTADETERDGMRLFVDKLVEYAPATLEIRLFYEEDPVASLKSGEADIIFVDSPVLEGYDSDFAIYSSPFYFRDYDHMSMTLNSPTFQDLTRDDYIESLGGRQLGAFYGGTMMLLTRDNPIRAVKDMEEFDLAALPDRYTSQSLAGLFRSVEEYGVFVELAPNLAGLAEPRPGARPGQQASVYIKSLIPERMKVKLIIIDSFDAPASAGPEPLTYYVQERHISRWDYSPEGCRKQVFTDFTADAADGDPDGMGPK